MTIGNLGQSSVKYLFQATSKPTLEKSEKKSPITKIINIFTDFFLNIFRFLTCNWCGKGRVTDKTKKKKNTETQKPDPKPETLAQREKRIEESANVQTLRTFELVLNQKSTEIANIMVLKPSSSATGSTTLDDLKVISEQIATLLSGIKDDTVAAKSSGKLIEQAALKQSEEQKTLLIEKADQLIAILKSEIASSPGKAETEKLEALKPKKKREDEADSTNPTPPPEVPVPKSQTHDLTKLATFIEAPKREPATPEGIDKSRGTAVEDESMKKEQALQAEKEKELASRARETEENQRRKDTSLETLDKLILEVSEVYQTFVTKAADFTSEVNKKVVQPYGILNTRLTAERVRIVSVMEYTLAQSTQSATNLSGFQKEIIRIDTVAAEIKKKVETQLHLNTAIETLVNSIDAAYETAIKLDAKNPLKDLLTTCFKAFSEHAVVQKEAATNEASQKLAEIVSHIKAMREFTEISELLVYITANLKGFISAEEMAEFIKRKEQMELVSNGGGIDSITIIEPEKDPVSLPGVESELVVSPSALASKENEQLALEADQKVKKGEKFLSETLALIDASRKVVADRFSAAPADKVAVKLADCFARFKPLVEAAEAKVRGDLKKTKKRKNLLTLTDKMSIMSKMTRLADIETAEKALLDALAK